MVAGTLSYGNFTCNVLPDAAIELSIGINIRNDRFEYYFFQFAVNYA